MSIVILSVMPAGAAAEAPTPAAPRAFDVSPASGASTAGAGARATAKAGGAGAFREALLKELGTANPGGKPAPGKQTDKRKAHHDRPDAATAPGMPRAGTLSPPAVPAPAANEAVTQPDAAAHAVWAKVPAGRAPRLQRVASLPVSAQDASSENSKAAARVDQRSDALSGPSTAPQAAAAGAPHAAQLSLVPLPRSGAAAPPPAPPPPTALAVGVPVTHAGWGSGFADRIAWMANAGVQHAELHLNPPELGPLQVSLTLHNHQASAQFVSHHAAVREAVEAALPRLKDMLANSGIALGSATVGADTSSSRSSDPQHGAARRGQRAQNPRSAELAPLSGATVLRLPQGVVDIFA